MERPTRRHARHVLIALATLGCLLVAVAALHGWAELWDKRWTLATGVLLIAVSLILLRSSGESRPEVSSPLEPSRHDGWPSPRQWGIAATLALAVTVVELVVSLHYGLLARPAYYDGAGYLYEARREYVSLAQAFESPREAARSAFRNRHPLWLGLIAANFSVLGPGEWQAFAVRFWSALGLLLLVVWVVRRRTGGALAWAAALCTCMLPTVSVSLHALVGRFFQLPGTIPDAWYLADLRPDLLSAVLLAFALVPLFERVTSLDARTWIVSGAAAALAILAKASAIGIIGLAWGCGILYVFGVNRRRLGATWQSARWALLPLALLLSPWIIFRGLEMTIEYVYFVVTAERALYSTASPTLLSEAGYYWRWLTAHMGAMGWSILACGLAIFAASWRDREQRLRAGGYLTVSLILYLQTSLMAVKNYFVGLPYYLLWWIFGWAMLAYLVERRPRWRPAAVALALAALVYAGVLLGAGAYALRHVSRLDDPSFHDQPLTARVARDLRARLQDGDRFVSVPGYGYPAAFQFHMVGPTGRAPEPIMVRAAGLPPPPDFIREQVSRCKAVMVYEEDIQVVARYLEVWPQTVPYYRAIAEWVRRPQSRYRLEQTYRLAPRPDRPAGLTIQLYVR